MSDGGAARPASPDAPAQVDAPADVVALAGRRAQARAARDWPAADAAREELRARGWLVEDSPAGYRLSPAPPFSPAATVAALVPDEPIPPVRRVGVGLVVDGWPADVATCVRAWLEHTDAVVVALDLGDVDGAGHELARLGREAGDRLEHHHVERPCGWGEAREALLALDASEVHVVADVSSVVQGDVLSPLLAELEDPSVSVAAWRGVDAAADWRSFEPAGPGEVDAALGYLFALRRADGLAVGPPRAARYYRNADMEWSFLLREGLRAQGRGRVVVPSGELPVRQGRHHGYADTPEPRRSRESKRTYDRFLARFRGRDDLRAGRSGGGG